MRTRRAAWLQIADNAKPIRCVLWDQSDSGARLAPAYANKLPDVFTLVLDKATARRCRIVWRKGPLVGVKFLSGDDGEQSCGAPANKPPPIDLSPELLASIRLPAAITAPDSPIPGGPPVSFFAAGFVLVLIGLTVLFYFADRESGSGAAWAAAVCAQASSLCAHPEFPAGGSVLMALVYFVARGMEV